MDVVKLEKLKFLFDIGVTVFGLLAALFAVLSLIYNSKLDYAKKIEEDKFKVKIAESNAVAEKAKVEAATAFENAARTSERAKEIELQLEDQKERAAIAEKDLLNLKKKIKPRTISMDNVNAMLNELGRYKKGDINISSSFGDGEAVYFANQFKMMFEKAGWKVSSNIGHSFYTGIGVYMLTKTNNNIEAKGIVKILSSFGIKVQEQIMEEGVNMELFIGSKDNEDQN